MATNKNKDRNIMGYRSVIWLAGLVGIIGGFLFGIWDSITVIIFRGLPANAISEMLSLSLYSVSIYTILGCLGMAVIGVFSGVLINIGKYQVNRLQLARIFIGVFMLLAVSALLSGNFMLGNITDIVEGTLIGIFSGVGIAVLAIYTLTYIQGRGIRTEKIIAICITLFISLLVLVFGGLLINMKLLPAEKFYQPISLLANAGLLVLVVLMAIGINVLSMSILKRYSFIESRRTGYTLLTLLLCVFLVISVVGPFNGDKVNITASAVAKGKPNILWIVMDTVRADHLSCYGYNCNTTPNIDKIASEGILYENTISAAPWTLPSHASMFTGMFPSKHGTDAEHQWLDDEFQTIAEVLRMNGYQTFEYTNNKYVGPHYNLSQGFNIAEACWLGKIEAGKELADYLKISVLKRDIQNNLRIDDGAHRTNKVVKKWIAEANKAEAPFFIFINYMEAHEPYHPPQDYVIPYMKGEEDLKKAETVNKDGVLYATRKIQMSEDDFRILRALYDGEISYLDYKMGQLFDYLKKLGIFDNTILIITADHGQNIGDHHLMGHRFCVYDTLLHVPLIIRYPDIFQAGLRVEEQVQLTDIFPTILDAIGINWDGVEQIQGYSLLRDRKEYPLAFAVAEHAIWYDVLPELRVANRNFDYTIFARRLKSIRTGEYKYIWGSDGYDELYNIRLDPEELNNLIEAEPAKASEMRQMLTEWLDSFEPYIYEIDPRKQ